MIGLHDFQFGGVVTGQGGKGPVTFQILGNGFVGQVLQVTLQPSLFFEMGHQCRKEVAVERFRGFRVGRGLF
ncbi:MAG: hypothetical protein BWX80_01477 [Candidatus Hydrogenedentes bacterium ADurb.Bin101]|nr:MAG: hypothetical protein BWX80_01477 [Candidatus Hydrogenedentes bacterium ADurb.Bin101]